MKRLLLFVSLLMLSAGVDAVARQKDDLCTWTTVSFSKSFGTDHRWNAGFDVELTDDISIRPEYIYLAYHNHAGRYARRTYDDHIVYMTFIVKL